MAQWDLAKARKAIDAAKKARDQSDTIYREAMELTFPDRENWTTRQEGASASVYNWDSAPTASVMRAANRLSSDFTPQFTDWVEIGLGPAAENMDEERFQEIFGRTKEEAKQQLENTTSVVQAIFNGPGFPTAANELYIDWHYGQGGMRIMPNDDIVGEPIIFQSMPLSHFYAYEGPNGRLDRWFLWHKLRPDSIQAQWPDAQMSEKLNELAEKPEPKPVDLVSVVYRDYDERDRPWRYEVFHCSGKDNARLVERRTRTPPFVTPRYSKLAGENRGRGPILFALPDIRTANKIVELTLRAVALAVSGVYTAEDNGLQGPVQIKPYSVIKVKRNPGTAGGGSLQRLDMPQRVDMGELVLEKLHENIKKIMGDNSLPPEAGPIRSATEFVQRARELVADQAGGLGRLYAEFIIPTVQRVVDILERKQILPSDGLEIDQFLIEVRMSSPLAKGEAMSEVENVVRFMEMLTALGGQELMAYEMDMGTVGGWMGDQMNVPRTVRNDEEQKREIRQAMAQQGAQQAGGDPEVASEELAQREERQQRGRTQ